MKPRPAVKLSALRQIGWVYWDPIGIRDCVNADFSDGPADEYDAYLIAAFGMAQTGRPEAEIAAYLETIATEHMGLGPSRDGGAASAETAARLRILASELT